MSELSNVFMKSLGDNKSRFSSTPFVLYMPDGGHIKFVTMRLQRVAESLRIKLNVRKSLTPVMLSGTYAPLLHQALL